MSPEKIAQDIISEHYHGGKKIDKENVSPEVWNIICEKLTDRNRWSNLTINGEVVAWMYISVEAEMDDDSDDRTYSLSNGMSAEPW